jgi:hypothetical protein
MSNINNNTSNTAIPGMLLPTQQGLLAGNPRDSAIAAGNASNLKLQALQSIGGRGKGKRLRKRRGGAGATTIAVPQFSMQYTPQGGPGQDPNSIIQQNAAVGTQSAANAVYDKYATQNGGYYNNMNMNMNTNQYQWGCYSGGKKYKKNCIKKTSNKKRTKRNKSGNRKSRKTKKH